MKEKSELKSELKERISLYLETGAPVLLIGAPGGGKTAICEQIAKETGSHYFEFRLSQINPEDFLGVPFVKDGFVETALRREWEEIFSLLSKGEKVLINFDELNRAPREVSNTAFGLINERRLGKLDFKFGNNNLMIIATANKGEEDGTFVEEWDSALLNRFIVLPLETNDLYKEFIIWGEKALPKVTSFLKIYKNFYYYKSQNLLVTPRSWEKVERLLNLGIENKKLEKLLRPIIGEEASLILLKFMNEKKTTITPEMIFSGQSCSEKIEKEEELNSVLNKCILVLKTKSEEISAEEIKNFIAFFFKEEHYNKLNQETMFLFIQFIKNKKEASTSKFLKNLNNKNFREFIKKTMMVF